jgi:hypothetical protein
LSALKEQYNQKAGDPSGNTEGIARDENKVYHNEDHWRKNVYDMKKGDEEGAGDKWPGGVKSTFHEFKNRVCYFDLLIYED